MTQLFDSVTTKRDVYETFEPRPLMPEHGLEFFSLRTKWNTVPEMRATHVIGRRAVQRMLTRNRVTISLPMPYRAPYGYSSATPRPLLICTQCGLGVAMPPQNPLAVRALCDHGLWLLPWKRQPEIDAAKRLGVPVEACLCCGGSVIIKSDWSRTPRNSERSPVTGDPLPFCGKTCRRRYHLIAMGRDLV